MIPNEVAPPSATLSEVCALLSSGNVDDAKALLQARYPFVAPELSRRAYTPHESMDVFVRDGFVDRYSGARLVFPGTLRLIHRIAPQEFPFQKNWKMSETHIAFWDLFPTVDHIYSIPRGGEDKPDNWITTSQLRNSAKANWTLEELGWQKHPPGSVSDWDGLSRWFLAYVKLHPEHLADPYLATWHRAAEAYESRLIQTPGTGIDI
jgi:hypothetical protein